MICVSKEPRTLHADVPTLTAHRSSFCHAELVSASVSGDVLEMARSGILKQVQDDHQLCSVVFCPYVNSHRSQLIAHNSKICRICVISVPMKIFYKTVFPYKSSCKVESAQLENFYFPVRKLIFSSWKVKISQ